MEENPSPLTLKQDETLKKKKTEKKSLKKKKKGASQI